MAALDAAWRDVDLTGVVVTRYGQGAPAGRIAVIAAPPLALSAAADAAAKAGLTSLILGNAIEGESRQVGIVMAEIARPVRLNGGPVQAPAILP
jgi:glycerate-2-kinase